MYSALQGLSSYLKLGWFKKCPGGRVVNTLDFGSWGLGFKPCWRWCSSHDCTALHCTKPFMITLPSSWYDLNNVERGIKHQIIIRYWFNFYPFQALPSLHFRPNPFLLTLRSLSGLEQFLVNWQTSCHLVPCDSSHSFSFILFFFFFF